MLISSFGAILKTFRKRRRISQRVLAELLGVHRNTIWSWEQGNYLPDSKGMILELARLLYLDESETGQLLQSSLTGLSPLWSVPSRRNPFFTGREQILQHLHEQLSTNTGEVMLRAAALQGLGGIGKTATALEYAYRFAQYYAATFWIEAETTESINASFLRIAEQLSLPELEKADLSQIITAVQRWLSDHRDWLLIWDNVEDLEVLTRALPPTREGSLLLTTRRQALGTLAQGIELSSMTPEEGLFFLLRRAKVLPKEASCGDLYELREKMPEESMAAQELVAVLGGLPLALDQAGAYVEETPCSLQDYLALYQVRRAELLSRRGEPAIDHPASVVTTWSLSFEQVERANGTAADLLRLCAFLHPDVIPEELLRQGTEFLGERLAAGEADAFQFHEALRVLSTYSLLKHQVQECTLSIHRLVQAVLIEGMSEEEREMWQWRAIHLLNAAFPDISPWNWKLCERLLPHMLTCAAGISESVVALDLAEILRKAADYMRGRARFEQAEPLYQRALRIEEQAVGPYHLRMAAPLYGLSLLYWEQGKYAQAELLGLRALSIWEHALDPEHPDLARPLIGLGLVYFNQGKYAQAEHLYRRAWHLRERTFGPMHSKLISPLINMADVYNEQGKYDLAEPLYRRAIEIYEQAQDAERPLIAYALCGLARLYSRQGKDEQAQALYQRALLVREQELGVEHPYVAEPLTGLGIISFNQRKYEQAKRLYQRAIRIAKQALGESHPDVATPLTHLADLFVRQGKYEQAEALYRRALRIRQLALGESHPLVITVLSSLATLSQRQKNYLEAELLSQ